MEALARAKFSDFFKLFPPNKPYIWGGHTYDKLRHMDDAVQGRKEGRSVYKILTEPPRHGKSDASSKRLPAYWHATFPDDDIILAANTAELAEDFSDKNRQILVETSGIWKRSPGKGKWALNRWSLEGCRGTFNAIGVGGTIMGRGGSLIVIDDPYENREQVESEVERQKVWDWFRSVIFTRRAPVCGMIISMQRWHPDDLVGKILAKNTPGNPDYDPEFPVFEVVNYKAQSPAYVTEANPHGWLFPERFSDAYYRETRAATGDYAWASQYLQEPAARFGNLFPVRVAGEDDNPTVQIVDQTPPGPYERGWDIASSEKQLKKDDPDYSAGVKACITDYQGARWLLVKHARRFRKLAGARNDEIVSTARADGPQTRVRMETVGGYIDAYRQVKEALQGEISVSRSTPHYDKVNRANLLLPFFESGHVMIERGPWNDDWLDEFRNFPSGTHDDYVDATILAVDEQASRRSGKPVIETPLDPLIIKLQPSLYLDNSGVLRKRFVGSPPPAPDMLDLYEPPGILLRTTYLGRREPSSSLTIFVDSDNAWHVIEAVEGHGDAFAQNTLSQLFDPWTREYFPLQTDLLTSDDDEESLYAFEEQLHRAAHVLGYPTDYPLPQWVPPRQVDGKSGIDTIEARCSASADHRKGGLYIFPPSVLLSLRDARTRPQSVQREGVEGREEVDVTSHMRALKMLAARWRE